MMESTWIAIAAGMQAAAGVVLVGITASYVRLTKHLVDTSRAQLADARAILEAQTGTLHGIPWTGQFTCGHNPCLFARLVDNLQFAQGPEGRSPAKWDERPAPAGRT
jgi:hypothetical protein